MFIPFADAKRIITAGALAVLLAAGAVAALAGPAAAQVDPSAKTIVQLNERGQWVERGQIFVPVKDDKANYVEHWVLYPDYVYPSATNHAELRIVDSKHPEIDSASAFFAQKFPQGSRYVQVISHESDSVPTSEPKTDLSAPTQAARAAAAASLGGPLGTVGAVAAIAAWLLVARLRSRRADHTRA